MVTYTGSTVAAISAAFHYRFITFKSAFPIVKENLIFWYSLRTALGLSLLNMLIKYHIPSLYMPRVYYVCSGQDPASGLDTDQRFKWNYVFEPSIILAYFVFSVLITREKYKQAGVYYSQSQRVVTSPSEK